MVDDLSDVWKELRALKAEVRQARTATPFENASVSNGRLRFIGGTLRVDSGGTVSIEGFLHVQGQTDLVGPVTISGPWTFSGDGDITGDVDLDGTMTVRDGEIVVEGTTPIRLASTSEGVAAISFGGGKGLYAVDGTIFINGQGGAIGVDEEGVAAQIPPLPSGMASKYVVQGTDGYLYYVSSGGPDPGGPGDGGDPGTPGDNPGGYIYPVNPDAWTLGDDFAAHVARGSAEPGIDWWTSIGTPIWAPGDGTVIAVQSSYAGATGAFVTLGTDHGDWFRFLHLSSTNVSVGQTVSQGDVLGLSGGSGFGSPAGYGPHIHVSFKVGYSGAFPGGGALDDFIAYMA